MKNLKFSGPLFIIGTSRSGTKLLRDLLNNHDNIFLTISETHFVPGMLKKYSGLHFNSDYKEQFYKEFIKSNFHLKMLKHGQLLSKTQFTEYTQNCYSIESIIELIVKFYSTNGFGLVNSNSSFIWGDKTPLYSNYIDLLKQQYPKAKFINMLRDPRDVALSFKKSWGKSLYSSAHKWKDTVKKVDSQSFNCKDDFIEIRYEDLTSKPESTLRRICNFLDCDFDANLLNLSTSSEFYGDAKGLTKILVGNVNKYRSVLRAHQIKRIEEISYDTAIQKDYPIFYAEASNGLNKVQINLYRIYDFIKYSLHIIIKERGFVEGSTYLYRSLRSRIRN